MKSLITIAILLAISAASIGQDTTVQRTFILTLKRAISFHPGEGYPRATTLKNRFNIRATESVQFTMRDGYDYLKAVYKKKPGWVEAKEVSYEYQNYGTENQEVDLRSLVINTAGSKIRKGANTVLMGTFISLGGSVAGLLIAKKKPDLGYGIAAGSGALGLILNIAGLGGIASGGGKMEEFRN